VRFKVPEPIVPACSASHNHGHNASAYKIFILTSAAPRDCRWLSSIQSLTSALPAQYPRQIATTTHPHLDRATLEARTNHARNQFELQSGCLKSFDNARARERLLNLNHRQAIHQSEESGDAKELVESTNSKQCREPDQRIRESHAIHAKKRISNHVTHTHTFIMCELVKFPICPKQLVPDIAISWLYSSRNHTLCR